MPPVDLFVLFFALGVSLSWSELPVLSGVTSCWFRIRRFTAASAIILLGEKFVGCFSTRPRLLT